MFPSDFFLLCFHDWYYHCKHFPFRNSPAAPVTLERMTSTNKLPWQICHQLPQTADIPQSSHQTLTLRSWSEQAYTCGTLGRLSGGNKIKLNFPVQIFIGVTQLHSNMLSAEMVTQCQQLNRDFAITLTRNEGLNKQHPSLPYRWRLCCQSTQQSPATHTALQREIQLPMFIFLRLLQKFPFSSDFKKCHWFFFFFRLFNMLVSFQIRGQLGLILLRWSGVYTEHGLCRAQC